jgi:uncharacterized 2Fe-2S/4Fe-4S cluster protein (DUF4445 family)
MILGLIPDCDLAHVVAVGNAAGDGALLMLLSRARRQEAAGLADWVEHLQTATDPYFQDEFVGALHIPHAGDAFPHLAPILAQAEALRTIRPAAAINGHGAASAQRAQRRADRRERRGQENRETKELS